MDPPRDINSSGKSLTAPSGAFNSSGESLNSPEESLTAPSVIWWLPPWMRRTIQLDTPGSSDSHTDSHELRFPDVLQSGMGSVLMYLLSIMGGVLMYLPSVMGRVLMYLQSGRDVGTVQLVSHGYNDSHTEDIESATTQLNTETTAATQDPPNGTRVEEQPLFNQPMSLVTLWGLASQAGLTMLTIRTSDGSTRFSRNQKILFCSAAAFNVISYLSFLFAILVRGRRPGIARILTGTGVLCTAYAFVGIMAMQFLKDNEMLWVAGLAAIALFPVFAFME